MRVLTPGTEFAAFVGRIKTAPARVLMLDYDGTLAPFHVEPARAVPYEGVIAMLEEIVNAGMTRVILVSGRPAEALPPLLPLTRLPEIWGAHGWERLLPDGRLLVEEPDEAALEALAHAFRITRETLPAGVRLEQKRSSLAMHWRGLSAQSAADIHARAFAAWSPLVLEHALEILPFAGGLELRAHGRNKQYAVQAVLSETPQGSAVAYLGDDITDEDAFRAVKPRGLAVLVRPEFRETAADVWIHPPDELLSFMRHWAPKKA